MKGRASVDQGSSDLRDPATSLERYEECIELLQENVKVSLEKGPALFAQVAEYYVRIARATYSAGKSAKECKNHLESSAKYQLRFFRETLAGKMNGIGDFERYLEWFAASDLTGNAQQVVNAFRSLSVSGTRPWQDSLIKQLGAVFSGEPVVWAKKQSEEVRAVKEYAALPSLFQAVSDGNVNELGTALEAFLTTSWGPLADRRAKGDLKLPYPAYAGKWSFFSAAICRRIGQVPQLSKKAKEYVPADVLEP